MYTEGLSIRLEPIGNNSEQATKTEPELHDTSNRTIGRGRHNSSIEQHKHETAHK